MGCWAAAAAHVAIAFHFFPLSRSHVFHQQWKLVRIYGVICMKVCGVKCRNNTEHRELIGCMNWMYARGARGEHAIFTLDGEITPHSSSVIVALRKVHASIRSVERKLLLSFETPRNATTRFHFAYEMFVLFLGSALSTPQSELEFMQIFTTEFRYCWPDWDPSIQMTSTHCTSRVQCHAMRVQKYRRRRHGNHRHKQPAVAAITKHIFVHLMRQ